MAVPAGSSARAPAAAKRDEYRQIADEFVALMRAFARARARLHAAAARNVEWSAHLLLKRLRDEGPMRAGTLAECVHSDPSTVSRQVAALVKDGLLERRADPEDGRASLLVATSAADEVLAEYDDIRLDFFARVLQNWPPEEMRRFAVLLSRFTGDFDAANATYFNERIGAHPAATGGSNE